MKVVKIWIADEGICREKLSYVLLNINIHPLCHSLIEFKITSDLHQADMVYGTSDTFIIPAAIYSMNADKTLLSKDLPRIQFDILPFKIPEKHIYFIQPKASDRVKRGKPINALPDLFESLFFHWSRYEEVTYPEEKRDQWDLMPENVLWVIKNKLHHTPFLDDLLIWFIRLFLPDFQNKQKSEVILTCDIDYLHFDELSLLENFRNLLMLFWKSRNKVKAPFQFLKYLFTGKVDFKFYEENKNPKIYFFLVGGHHRYDFPKSEKSMVRIKSVVKEALSNGCEVGIHPSFNACYSYELMKNEIECLEKMVGHKITQSRQHYLHIDYRQTIPLLELFGIEEDFSMGFNMQPGYKAGTAASFYYWNWHKGKVSSVKSRPLIWMDSAQWFEAEKNVNRYEAMKRQFFKNPAYGTVYTNEHPLFQQKIQWLKGEE